MALVIFLEYKSADETREQYKRELLLKKRITFGAITLNFLDKMSLLPSSYYLMALKIGLRRYILNYIFIYLLIRGCIHACGMESDFIISGLGVLSLCLF